MAIARKRTILWGTGVVVAVVAVMLSVVWPRWQREQQRALELEAIRRNNLGVALLIEGNHEAAYGELVAAIDARPSYFAAQVNLVICQLSWHSESSWFYNKELRRNAERVLSLDARNPYGHYLLAMALETQGSYSEAEAHYRKVLEVDPEDYHSLDGLCRCLLGQERWSEAAELIEKAAEVFPAMAAFHYRLFLCYHKLNDKVRAQQQIERFKALRKVEETNTSFLFRWSTGSSAKSIVFGKYAQPIPDSRALAQRLEPQPRYADITTASGILFQHAGGVSGGAAIADFDADGRFDLFVGNTDGHHALYRQTAPLQFAEMAGSLGIDFDLKAASACLWGDHDGDADVDLFLGGPEGVRLYQNDGPRFNSVTQSSRLDPVFNCSTAAYVDVDHDGDLDLLLGAAGATAAPGLRLFRNQRDGTFADISQQALGASGKLPARALLCSDVDEDSLVDLLVYDDAGQPTVLRNQRDYTFAAVVDLKPPTLELPSTGESRAYGDLDNDGALDLLVNRSGQSSQLLRNVTVPENWLKMRFKSSAGKSHRNHSNAFVIGARAEVRAVAMWQTKELRLGNGLGGCDAPELVFDLGRERELDFARVLFPTGARRSQRAVSANQIIELEEPVLDRTSCPGVFSWDGSRFVFIADTISAGVFGELVGPGQFWDPDPDEWLRIESDRLVPRDGFLALRFTNSLEEVTYLDHVRLLAVDHPMDVEVHPDERMVMDPRSRRPSSLFAVTRERPLARVVDQRGDDVTEKLRHVDRRYFDGFVHLPFQGYAEAWSLTLDLGHLPADILLLHGWIQWAMPESGRSASQSGLELWGPRLEVLGVDGGWREALADVGIPAGLPRTMVVRLGGLLRPGEHTLRLRTNRRVYFDQALVADRAEEIAPAALQAAVGSGNSVKWTEVPLASAELRWLGFPQRLSPDGAEPPLFDYTQIEDRADWYRHPGYLTRYGEVLPLLSSVDGALAVMGTGDEVALSFNPTALPPPAGGTRRTYLLYSNGYEKAYDPFSPITAAVEPLPWHESFSTEKHLQAAAEWNTRPSWAK